MNYLHSSHMRIRVFRVEKRYQFINEDTNADILSHNKECTQHIFGLPDKKIACFAAIGLSIGTIHW